MYYPWPPPIILKDAFWIPVFSEHLLTKAIPEMVFESNLAFFSSIIFTVALKLIFWYVFNSDEKVKVEFCLFYSTGWFPNLLTLRGKLLNILLTSETTVVRWADNNPALLEYSRTRSLELSTAMSLSTIFKGFTILELKELWVSAYFFDDFWIILSNSFLS